MANFIAQNRPFWKQGILVVTTDGPDRPYPAKWENVAHLRVFRTTAGDWPKVVSWRADMVKRGWRLLRVNSTPDEIVAVFGKTKIGQGS